MKELDACLRDLVAAVRAAYQPTLAHDALVRATIVELTQLDEPKQIAVTPPERSNESGLVCVHIVPNAAPPPVTVGAATEQEVIAILTAETVGRIADAFDRKEGQLRTVFCALRPLEAAALRKRLEAADPSDKLAVLFARFASERRTRLLAILADARRREALQQARGRVAMRGAR